MSILRRGDIFFADLGHKYRPYLVVQNDQGNRHSPRTIIVPLTTKAKKALPTHCTVCWGTICPSVVQCEEITHVDVSPRWRPVEHLPGYMMRRVDRALKVAIGVD